MYKVNKSLSILSLAIVMVLFFLKVFVSPVVAIDLPFDPNDYNFLIYDSEGDQDSIEDAMIYLGIPYDVRRYTGYLRQSGSLIPPLTEVHAEYNICGKGEYIQAGYCSCLRTRYHQDSILHE